MKAKNLCVYAGLCAGVASVATGQSQKNLDLQSVEAGQNVEPLRVAKAGMQDGKIVFQSDWMDYNGGAARATGVQIFDCYGDGSDGPFDGVMDGGTLCGLGGATSRWYFGTGYCNMFMTNDMTLDPATVLEDGAPRFDFAWFWTVNGSFTTEPCIVAVFTQESDPNLCEADSFDYSGWLLDYGSLASGVGGGYYYSNVTLTAGVWPLPDEGTGSYAIFFLTAVTTSGAFILATCAQSMLWGSPDAHGQYAANYTQDIGQFDDDVFLDGSHTSSECYTYSYTSLCPNVLGGMGQFIGNTGDDCLGQFPNCDGNSEVNTQDFLCFLGVWSQAFQTNTYDAAADCDGNGSINTQDFLCFLGLFANCF